MRTLKKTLGLVLALVLCLGLVSTAFAANIDKFADASQVGDKYAEAVNVLVGSGIVDGKSETELGATGTFTREQAAKIIAYMLLGKTTADLLPKDAASFSDVEAGRWSAGYIAYCFNQKIIDGVGDGKFNPQGQLTGYAWAKMLLGALGYNKNGEYNDPNTWLMNVATDALKAGVYTGDIGALVNEPIQRQQAMLGAFNTLFKGEPVTSTTTKYLTDGSVSGKKIFDTYAAAAASGDGITGQITVTETVVKGSLAETSFGLSKVATPTSDANGRPTTTYVANGKPIAVFESAPTKVYSAAVTGGKIYSDLGLTKAPTVTFTQDKVAAAAPAIADGNKTQIPGTGNGVELNVYYDAATNAVDLVLVNYYVGTVSDVDSKGVVTVKGGAPINGLTLKAAGLKKDDIVLATFDAGAGKLATLEKVNASTMTPNRYTATDFTANGLTYKYSANAVCAPYADPKFGETNVVLDKFGYVIDRPASGPVIIPTEYAIFLTSTTVPATWPDTTATYKAQIVKADGTKEIVATDKDYEGGAILAKGDVVICTAGTLANTGKTLFTAATVADTAGATPITKNVVTFGASKANDKTVFLVKTVATSGAETYTKYVGIGNIPSITTETKYTTINNATTGYAEFVYVDTATLYAAPTAASTVAFVDFSSGKAAVDSVKGAYTTYNAVVDGKITTIEVDTAKDPFTADGIFVNFTKNDKGLIVGATEMAGSATVTYVNNGIATVAPSSGVLGLNGNLYTYNASTVVYKVGSSIAASSVSAIKTDANDEVVYYVTNNIVTAVFITAK